jgi:serine/threonine-protein kinase RsbW
VEIRLALSLPRDELSIPVVRRLCTQSLRVLGAAEGCAEDLELALTEACTNVLRHAMEGDDYEVIAGIDGESAVLEIVDRGPGFDANALARAVSGEDADPDAETGRGLLIMQAVMDTVEFESRPGDAQTVVRLEKELQWREDAAAKQLTERERAASDGHASIDLTVEMRAIDSR